MPPNLWGVEFFYTDIRNSENSNFDALKVAAPSALPVTHELRSQYGIMAQWVPWYAKINVFNQILYFDWYFAGGLGKAKTALDDRQKATAIPSYATTDRSAFFISTGHLFHLNELISIRLDMNGTFYQVPLYGATGENTWASSFQAGLGIGVRL